MAGIERTGAEGPRSERAGAAACGPQTSKSITSRSNDKPKRHAQMTTSNITRKRQALLQQRPDMIVELADDGLVIPQAPPEGHVALIPLKPELDFLAVVGVSCYPVGEQKPHGNDGGRLAGRVLHGADETQHEELAGPLMRVALGLLPLDLDKESLARFLIEYGELGDHAVRTLPPGPFRLSCPVAPT